MEIPNSDPIIFLKVKKMCCRSYQRELKKKLEELEGVCAVFIDPEKKRVSVQGRVDSNLLLETIEGTGKKAEILGVDRNSTDGKSHHHEEEFKPYRNVTGRCPHEAKNRAQQYGCSSNGHKFEEEEHKCEEYVPSEIDERICRDYWCKEHKQRSIFHDKVPASASTGIFGYPFRDPGAPFHFANNPWQPYGHRGPGYLQRSPLPPAYGYRSGGYMPGFGHHGF